MCTFEHHSPEIGGGLELWGDVAYAQVRRPKSNLDWDLCECQLGMGKQRVGGRRDPSGALKWDRCGRSRVVSEGVAMRDVKYLGVFRLPVRSSQGRVPYTSLE